jgi:hypothetical protein
LLLLLLPQMRRLFAVAVVVAALVVASALATEHSQSALIANCKVVGALPIEVTEDGVCYQFTRDLEWGGAAQAFVWSGANGELHFRGYTLTLTSTIEVETAAVRTYLNGGVRVFNARVVAPRQLNNVGTAFEAGDNATLEVYDAFTQNLGWGIYADGESTVMVNGWHHDGIVDAGTDIYGGEPYWGAALWQHVTATFENVNIHFVQSSVLPPFAARIGFSYGISTNTYYLDVSEGVVRKPTLTIRSALIRAHSGIEHHTTQNLIVEDTTVRVLPVITFPGAQRGLSYYASDYSIGVQLGMGIAAAQASLRNVEIDMSAVISDTEAVGLGICATNGVDVDGLRVYGHSYLSTSEYDDGFFPRYRQLGLVSVFPWQWNGFSSLGLAGQPSLSPIRLRNVELLAQDNDTVCLQVLADCVIDADTFVAHTSITVEHASFVGGSIGAIAGSGARDQFDCNFCAFSRSYYGLYAFDGSISQSLVNPSFTKLCIGVEQESGAAVMILREPSFLFNDVDTDFNGLLYDMIDDASEGEASYVCEVPEPTVYDSSTVVVV